MSERIKGQVIHFDEQRCEHYAIFPTKKVDGTVVERKVYGELKDCDICGMKFFRRKGTKTTTLCPMKGCKDKAAAKKRRETKQAKPSYKRDRADELFSKIVRTKAGYRCESGREGCKGGVMQCAHIYSRRFLGLRWDERNARCLCKGCHDFYTLWPDKWEDWRQENLDPETYAALRSEKDTLPNPDIDEVLTRLRARWSEIQREAA